MSCTGVKDKDGKLLYLGDIVRYNLEGSHTKIEYWNPEYEIIFNAPSFGLKWVGGGKDGGSHDFILRCGGGNGDLELIRRGVHYSTPTALKVKPLLWKENVFEDVYDKTIYADSPLGRFETFTFHTVGPNRRIIHGWSRPFAKDIYCDSFDEAKLMAEAHYESVVRSMIG